VAADNAGRLVDAFADKLELQKVGLAYTVYKTAVRVRISKIGGKKLRHILYMATLNAKKPTLLARRFTTGRGKREAQKRDHYCRVQQTAQASICRCKVRCAVPRRLLQKTGLKVWVFTRLVLAVLACHAVAFALFVDFLLVGRFSINALFSLSAFINALIASSSFFVNGLGSTTKSTSRGSFISPIVV
jgi:hypothetical protein